MIKAALDFSIIQTSDDIAELIYQSGNGRTFKMIETLDKLLKTKEPNLARPLMGAKCKCQNPAEKPGMINRLSTY